MRSYERYFRQLTVVAADRDRLLCNSVSKIRKEDEE